MAKLLCKRLYFFCLICLIAVSSLPQAVSAGVPYYTYSKDSNNRTVYTQPAYSPSRVIGTDLYVVNAEGKREYSPLRRPQDLYIDSNDTIYVSDTDNNRIVVFDKNGDLIKILAVPESPLNKPNGVFVDPKGDIYIADTGNKRVVRLNKDGQLLREFSRPSSTYINDAFVYEPINMIVDQRGFVYVVSTGSYQGIVQFDPTGEFYGFYGTNQTEVTGMDVIRRMFYTKEQLSRQVRLLPVTIRNIDIDRQGYIYTVSGSTSEQVKKLNISGDNLWKGLTFQTRERFFQSASGEQSIESQLNDITVDRESNLTVIDKTFNVVSQYNENGQLLFYWSGPSFVGNPQLGLNQSPVAVESNSKNELFILDDALNLIQVFKPTQFGNTVHKAYLLTQEGKYVESEPYWKQVIKQNALYSPAYKGLAQSAYYRGNYGEALNLYKLAGDSQGYSDSFWQIRLEWFQKYFSLMANVAIVIGLALLAGRKVRLQLKAKGWTLPLGEGHSSISWVRSKPANWPFKHALYILKHPIDGFSDLRYLNKGNYIKAVAMIVGVLFMLLVKTYLTGFTFNPIPADERRGGTLIIGFMAVFLTWVICAYLIGSIRQGEARLKDVFIGSAYALFPVILLGLPIAIISNIFTLSEASIYHFMESLVVIWCGMLFFWKIQSLQNYTVGETIIHILLTLAAMTMLWVLIFIMFGLASEFLDFVYTIYQEVSM